MSVEQVVSADPLTRAAFEAFVRHGYKRTTMADVADAAGMSRPALYLRVKGKDDLLRLVAGALLHSSLERARTAAAGSGPVAARAEAVLAAKLSLTQDLAEQSGHAAELLDHYHRLAPDMSSAYTADLHAILSTVLAGSGAPDELCATVATALISTVRGLELDLSTEDSHQVLHDLVATIAAGLASH